MYKRQYYLCNTDYDNSFFLSNNIKIYYNEIVWTMFDKATVDDYSTMIQMLNVETDE